jgi:hypothetical protein
VQFGHLKTCGRFVEAGVIERFSFRESLVDEAEDVGAIALLLQLATGNLSLDEPDHAFRQVTDFVGFLQKFRRYRNARHRGTFNTDRAGCKKTVVRYQLVAAATKLRRRAFLPLMTPMTPIRGDRRRAEMRPGEVCCALHGLKEGGDEGAKQAPGGKRAQFRFQQRDLTWG